MKGIDIAIVRHLPFLLYIIIGVQICRCWMGLDYYPFNLLHSNSAIFASALFFISLANKRYHCIYNRAMYVFLIATPIFNYLDAKIGLFDSVDVYLSCIIGAYLATLFITAFLAVKHFVDIRIRRIRRGRE